MKKFFSSLLLALFSVSTWAASNSQGLKGFSDNLAMNDHTDLSIAYLSQVFGSVGNVLHGVSGQMLGHLFYRLNEGIIVVAGLWLIYTVFTVVLRAAQDGSFMGANKNVALVFLKIALGFGLLIPNPTTGYSCLQDIVMKVVVEGVGLANQTWEYGLDYVSNGGSVWHPPEANGDGVNIVSKSVAQSILGYPQAEKVGPGRQIFANAVCMYSSTDNQINSDATSDTTKIQYRVIENEADQTFDFPGIGNLHLVPGQRNCGSVSWNVKNACEDPLSAKCMIAKQAVRDMINNLLPAAKKFYCSSTSGAPDSCKFSYTGNVEAYNSESFFGTMLNYVNAIMPLVQMNTPERGTDYDRKLFIDQAKREGWLSAGRYYWDLAQVQAYYNSVSDVGTYVPKANAPGSALVEGQPKEDYARAIKKSADYVKLDKLDNYAKTQHHGDAGTATNAANYFDNPTRSIDSSLSFVASLIDPIVVDISNLIALFSTGTNANSGMMGFDPIVFLHNIGIKCIAITGDIWLGLLVVIVVALAASSVCNAMLNVQGVITGILSWIRPFFMIIAGGLWVAGFMLAFYVPLYPYLIYTFGVIGWIIVVIEAMVAAPLICFGLTHPEGHDFLGECKQALMLLLGVFLRPVLMVIGLIAGMVLSYVSLRIIVYTFSGIVSDFFAFTPAKGEASGNVLLSVFAFMGHSMGDALVTGTSWVGVIMNLLVFPLTLVIFTMLVYVVTTQSFSLVFALPDNILRWIGAPTHMSQSAQMAQQIQGATTGFAQTSDQATKSQVESQRRKAELDSQSKDASQLSVAKGKPGGGGDDGDGAGGGAPGGVVG